MSWLRITWYRYLMWRRDPSPREPVAASALRKIDASDSAIAAQATNNYHWM